MRVKNEEWLWLLLTLALSPEGGEGTIQRNEAAALPEGGRR